MTSDPSHRRIGPILGPEILWGSCCDVLGHDLRLMHGGGGALMSVLWPPSPHSVWWKLALKERRIETTIDSGDIRVTDAAVRAAAAPIGSHHFLYLIDDAVGLSR